METRDDILAEIKTIMIEMFEVDDSKITLAASLYEDLDFDSIDAIDMIVRLKEMTGKAVNPEDFRSARTINDVVDVVEKMLKE
ncbi:hypothetical protein MCAMS1_02151 [biofilm metagenome]